MKYPYLLLDAGGTLVFPDLDLMARVAAAEGSVLEPEGLYEAHFHLMYQYDVHLREHTAPPSLSLRYFFQEMLIRAGAAKDAAARAVDKLLARHEETSLWTYTKPWVLETLAALKQNGFRMSVISNADGRVRRQLEVCGLAPYLDAVFDSHYVGFEKPNPEIFHHALNELGLAPAEAMYIGDHYHFDVLGANRAGIGAVHLDPLGCYAGWPGVHLRDFSALPEWMAAFGNNPAHFDLFPVRSQPRTA